MEVSPIPKPSAMIQEPICAGVAPAAAAAWNTMAAELVKPTRTAMKPATIGGSQAALCPAPGAASVLSVVFIGLPATPAERGARAGLCSGSRAGRLRPDTPRRRATRLPSACSHAQVS